MSGKNNATINRDSLFWRIIFAIGLSSSAFHIGDLIWGGPESAPGWGAALVVAGAALLLFVGIKYFRVSSSL